MIYAPASSFVCAQCGNCCRGEGYVRVTSEDIARLAGHLQTTVEAFIAAYTRTPEIEAHATAGDLWLLDKPGSDLECIFLTDNRCDIHVAKPVQCIGFPTKWRTPDIMDYCIGMQR